jgi:glycine cleavage system aminomethyltransferase T
VASPRFARTVALGYVHRDHAAPGTVLTVLLSGGPAAAVVSALPPGG